MRLQTPLVLLIIFIVSSKADVDVEFPATGEISYKKDGRSIIEYFNGEAIHVKVNNKLHYLYKIASKKQVKINDKRVCSKPEDDVKEFQFKQLKKEYESIKSTFDGVDDSDNDGCHDKDENQICIKDKKITSMKIKKGENIINFSEVSFKDKVTENNLLVPNGFYCKDFDTSAAKIDFSFADRYTMTMKTNIFKNNKKEGEEQKSALTFDKNELMLYKKEADNKAKIYYLKSGVLHEKEENKQCKMLVVIQKEQAPIVEYLNKDKIFVKYQSGEGFFSTDVDGAIISKWEDKKQRVTRMLTAEKSGLKFPVVINTIFSEDKPISSEYYRYYEKDADYDAKEHVKGVITVEEYKKEDKFLLDNSEVKDVNTCPPDKDDDFLFTLAYKTTDIDDIKAERYGDIKEAFRKKMFNVADSKIMQERIQSLTVEKNEAMFKITGRVKPHSTGKNLMVEEKQKKIEGEAKVSKIAGGDTLEKCLELCRTWTENDKFCQAVQYSEKNKCERIINELKRSEFKDDADTTIYHRSVKPQLIELTTAEFKQKLETSEKEKKLTFEATIEGKKYTFTLESLKPGKEDPAPKPIPEPVEGNGKYTKYFLKYSDASAKTEVDMSKPEHDSESCAKLCLRMRSENYICTTFEFQETEKICSLHTQGQPVELESKQGVATYKLNPTKEFKEGKSAKTVENQLIGKTSSKDDCGALCLFNSISVAKLTKEENGLNFPLKESCQNFQYLNEKCYLFGKNDKDEAAGEGATKVFERMYGARFEEGERYKLVINDGELKADATKENCYSSCVVGNNWEQCGAVTICEKDNKMACFVHKGKPELKKPDSEDKATDCTLYSRFEPYKKEPTKPEEEEETTKKPDSASNSFKKGNHIIGSMMAFVFLMLM